MNAVVARAANMAAPELPVDLLLPRVSDALAGLVADIRASRPVTACVPALRDEARRLLPAWEMACAPVASAMVREWLLVISLGSAAPLEVREFDIRSAAIAELLEGLPGGAFTRRTRNAARFGRFFPGAPEVRQALAPACADLALTLRALRIVASLPAPPVSGPGLSQAERDRVLFEFQRVMAGVLPGYRRSAASSHVSDETAR